MTNELIADLRKAGQIIKQYQEFYHSLKDTAYRPLNVSNNPMQDSIEFYKIDKDEYEIYQKLKQIINAFEVKL